MQASMSSFQRSAGTAASNSKHDNKTNGGKHQKLSFMGKLVRILEESDPSIVRWSNSGESFVVLDVKRHDSIMIDVLVTRSSRSIRRFTSEVLTHWLRTTNFASFVRQLNYYGAFL